jgi:putative oxidoreductase
MNVSTRNPMLAIGRALLGALFFVSAITKIGAFGYVSGWIASSGLPLPDLVLVATIAIELIGGAMLITGWHARWAALGLAIFLVPVTLVFHAFWSADAAHFNDQLTAFLKNAAIFGGMLLVFERSRATAKA